MENEISPQALIETRMREIIALGNYETAHLFSEEGLPLAEASSGEPVDSDRLVEFSILFQEVKRIADVMGGISQLKEVSLEGNNRRKIAFRFLHAFGQSVILAVVIPPGKTYKSLTNRLVKTIEGVSF